MAQTLARAVAPASPPIPTAFLPPIRGLNRRFSNSTITSAQGPDCKNFDGFKTCSSNGDYGSCIAGGATSSCNCNYGLNYLDCLSAAISTSSCSGAVGVDDWEGYKVTWFQGACSKPPQSVMISLTQPSSIAISYTPVITYTPPGPIAAPPIHIDKPSYAGTGQLLAGACTSTSYTLIDAGSVVYQAAFVGCDADRPECCPWDVSTTAVAASAGGLLGNRVAGGGGGFPMPAAGALSALKNCPEDYYPVSGQCCPNGYYKFTSKIAYQTPCFSSFSSTLTPPPVTVGMVNNPTDTSKPTSAINNLAWAMGYNLTEPTSSGGLSQGATIGIGVGAGIFAFAVIALLAFVFIRVRRSKQAALQEQRLSENDAHPGTTYTPGYAVPHASSPSMSPPAAMGSPQMHQYQPPSQPQPQYSAGSWNQGYTDYGSPNPHEQQQGLQQPAIYDQGSYRR